MFKLSFMTRTIWIVSIVSLFTDISSEMLYPVMPIYLKTIGFSVLLIGILEGFAEATAGLSKGYFGKLSDITGKRLPFVQLGYFFSSLSKPMLAIFAYPVWIFMARFIDRLGKGLRTGARDALLSAEASNENKGKVFGFHRGMDTLGAAIGPILALVYLKYFPGEYQNLFMIAFLPAFLGVFFTCFIKEKKQNILTACDKNSKYNFLGYFSYWEQSTTSYKKLLIGFLAFTLFNSSDAFLLLMAKNQGIPDEQIIGVYIFYNMVYALFSYPAGCLADKIGMRYSFIIGLFLFILVYVGMAFMHNLELLYILFFLYGLYACTSEGISKAWIAKITPCNETGTAIGLYASISSIFTLLASSIAGLLWVIFNPSVPFIVSASGVFLVIMYFVIIKN